MTYAVVDSGCAHIDLRPRRAHAVHQDCGERCASGRRAEVFAPDGMVLGLNLDGGVRFERYLRS